MNTAIISECGRYRYTLHRAWNDDAPRMTYIMLNPSTADASKDDPTIRRCIGFAKREGCGGLNVVNLFAYRGTNPADMKAADDPVGPENDKWVGRIFATADGPRVVAWGADPFARERAARMGRAWRNLMCLGKTKSGAPRHPLYVPADAPLVAWP